VADHCVRLFGRRDVHLGLSLTSAFHLFSGRVPLFYCSSWLLYGVLVLYVTLDWNSRYYTINGKGVIVHEGVIFSKAIQYDMAAIESVALEQGLFGKAF